jgi:hypothetical protein
MTDIELERGDEPVMSAERLLPDLEASVWLPDPVGLSGEGVSEDLRTIGTAGRLLSSRLDELEAEVARQHVVAERLRQRLAAEMDARVTAEQSLAAAKQANLRTPRLSTGSAGPRSIYQRLRTAVGTRL